MLKRFEAKKNPRFAEALRGVSFQRGSEKISYLFVFATERRESARLVIERLFIRSSTIFTVGQTISSPSWGVGHSWAGLLLGSPA